MPLIKPKPADGLQNYLPVAISCTCESSGSKEIRVKQLRVQMSDSFASPEVDV